MDSVNNENQIIIPKEDAVFWMDAQGRWCNQYGPFEHPKIIRYFNRAIGKDADGYFVAQIRDGFHEKVYFRYADTPLFVVDLEDADPMVLVLNTGRRLELDPRCLYIENDLLYLSADDEKVKFNERMLMRFADWLEERSGGVYFSRGGQFVKIAER
jgi:hypothetical protein